MNPPEVKRPRQEDTQDQGPSKIVAKEHKTANEEEEDCQIVNGDAFETAYKKEEERIYHSLKELLPKCRDLYYKSLGKPEYERFTDDFDFAREVLEEIEPGELYESMKSSKLCYIWVIIEVYLKGGFLENGCEDYWKNSDYCFSRLKSDYNFDVGYTGTFPIDLVTHFLHCILKGSIDMMHEITKTALEFKEKQ